MFDHLKMSASQFILNLKHGVYVFVSDSCEFCKDYAESLKYIENCNLHIVECTTDTDKSAIYQITGRSVLPITAAWYDNELQWVTLGQLYVEEEGSDPLQEGEWSINKVVKYLQDTFGDKPLTTEEIAEKTEACSKHCIPTYYVFPPNTSTSVKRQMFEKAYEHNELPFDVDNVASIENLSDKDRYIMLKSNIATFKLVVFDVSSTSVYSDVANRLLADYLNGKLLTGKFEMRDL